MSVATQFTFQFCGLPFEIVDEAAPGIIPDRAVYRERCGWRWSGPALVDAKGNWKTWREIHPDLERALRTFERNPYMEDAGGRSHNPEGTLTAFLWKLQEAWEPDRGTLYPLLGFCERYQRVHLGRGLLIYCGMVLDAIRQNHDH